MLAKFLVYFPLSLAEVSRAYVVRGASGDDWGELIGGKGTIGLQAAVPKRPPHATLNFMSCLSRRRNGFTAVSLCDMQ